jgi:hypothetical protein
MKRKDVLMIIVPTLIFVIFWILFSIYHNFVSSTIPETLNIQINPINPSFDDNTVNAIKKRTQINPLYQLSTPSAAVTNIPIIPTPTGTSNQTQASTGGSLTP